MASLGLEFLDIEIIKPATNTQERWDCDQCSLFYLSKQKLEEHKSKVHTSTLDVKCKYCGKELTSNDSKESVSNQKCGTCEYRCNNCPQRFLRLSSLVNHEKQNSCTKKKKPGMPNKTPVNGAAPVKTIKTLLPRKRPPDQLENESSTVQNKNSKPADTESPRKKPKLQTSKVSTVLSNNNTKTPKEPKKRSKSLPVSETSKNSKPTTPQKNPTTETCSDSTSPQMNNPVNYKPFSCHICGDNFASGEILLDHIKTHGDAANSFKCKFCNEEFVSIYEMQFHLATCDLADNEIETLQNVIPPPKLTPKKSNDEKLEIRKRGRPKKDQPEVGKVSTEAVETTRRRRRKKSVEGIQEEPKETEQANKMIKTGNASTQPKRSLSKRRSRATKEPSSPPPDPSPPPPQASPEPTAVVDCGAPPTEDNEEDYNLEYSEDPLADGGPATENATDEKKIHACWFPRCSFKFTREKALLCHMRNHELGLGPDVDEHLKCYRCDVPFDDLASLRLHINECKGLIEETDNDFQSRKPPKQKRQSPTKASTSQPFQSINSFRCNACERVYPSEEKLNRCRCRQVIECRLCAMKCEGEEALTKHFSARHAGRLPFRCEDCSTEYSQQSGHTCSASSSITASSSTISASSSITASSSTISASSSITAAVSECIICHQTFPDLNQLYTHYNEDHLKENQCICKTCNKLFPDQEALKDHRRQTHRFEKRFGCTFCPKSFSNGFSLNLHLKTHTNALIIKCPLCYKIFFECDSLTKHMFFHANIAPVGPSFKCCFCAAPFSQKVGLKNHFQNNHVMDKCLICKLSSSQIEEDDMQNHLLKHSVRICQGKIDKNESMWVNQSKTKKEPVETNLEGRRNRRSKTMEMNKTVGDEEENLSISKRQGLPKEKDGVKSQKSEFEKEDRAEKEKRTENQSNNLEKKIKTQLQISSPKHLKGTRASMTLKGFRGFDDVTKAGVSIPENNETPKVSSRRSLMATRSTKASQGSPMTSSEDHDDQLKATVKKSGTREVESQPQKVRSRMSLITGRSTKEHLKNREDQTKDKIKKSGAIKTKSQQLVSSHQEVTFCNDQIKPVRTRVPKPDKSTDKVATPRSSKRTPKPVSFDNFECGSLKSKSSQNVSANGEMKSPNLVQKEEINHSAKVIKVDDKNLSIESKQGEAKQRSSRRRSTKVPQEIMNNDYENSSVKSHKYKVVKSSEKVETPRSSKRTPKPVGFKNYECVPFGSKSTENEPCNNEMKQQQNLKEELDFSERLTNSSKKNLTVGSKLNEAKPCSLKRPMEEKPEIDQELATKSRRMENKKIKLEINEKIKSEIISPLINTTFENKERPMSFIFVTKNTRASIKKNPLNHLTPKCVEDPGRKILEEENSTGNVNIQNEDDSVRKFQNRVDIPEYIVPEIMDMEKDCQNYSGEASLREDAQIEQSSTSMEYGNNLSIIGGPYSSNAPHSKDLILEDKPRSVNEAKNSTAQNIQHDKYENKPETVEQEICVKNNVQVKLMDTVVEDELGNIVSKNNLGNSEDSKDRAVECLPEIIKLGQEKIYNQFLIGETSTNEFGNIPSVRNLEEQSKSQTKTNTGNSSKPITEYNLENSTCENDRQENIEPYSKQETGVKLENARSIKVLKINDGQNLINKSKEKIFDNTDRPTVSENCAGTHREDESLNRTHIDTENEIKNHQKVNTSEIKFDETNDEASTGSINCKSTTALIEDGDLSEAEIIKLLHEELQKQENEYETTNEKPNSNAEKYFNKEVEATLNRKEENGQEETNEKTRAAQEQKIKKIGKKKGENSKFIKEKKYYTPVISLTPYSCTTCIESFSSEAELLQHNVLHIF